MLDRTKQPEVTMFPKMEFSFPEPLLLDNGVKLYVVNNEELEVNRLAVHMVGGSMEEPKPLLSQMMVGSLVNGTGNMTSHEVSETLDYYGSLCSSKSLNHRTVFTLSSLSRNFEHTLPLMFQLVTNPSFPASEFDLMKNRLVSAFGTARQTVSYLASIKMWEMCYGPRHPMALNLTDQQIMDVTIDDVRRMHAERYCKENSILVLSGHATDAEISRVNSIFGQWPTVGEKKTDMTKWVSTPSDEGLVIVDKPGALQSAVYMSIRTIPRTHPDYIKLRVAVVALGGYFGSRLMKNIREDKGYTYGINSGLLGTENEGVVVVVSQCGIEYTWPLIEEVKHEIEKLGKEPMDDEELHGLRQYLLSEFVKNLDTPFEIADYIDAYINNGLPKDYFTQSVSQILDITGEDIMEMAQKYLKVDKIRISIASDRKKLGK